MEAARCAALPPRAQRHKEIEAGAKAKFGNLEPVRKPRRQVVARQKHMPRFLEPIVEREIGIVEPARDGDHFVAPIEVGLLVDHRLMP